MTEVSPAGVSGHPAGLMKSIQNIGPEGQAIREGLWISADQSMTPPSTSIR